jgi:outer membrane protein OmpA-like peptidoglycan-associated protein
MSVQLSTSLCIIAGVLLWLKWLDGFHLLSAACAVAIWIVVRSWWRRRNADPELDDAVAQDEEDDDHSDGENRAGSVIRGALAGGLLTGLTALLAAALATTPVYGLFYDAGCGKLLTEVEVLSKGGAHAYALELVDKRLGRRASAACSTSLAEERARLLVAMSGTAVHPERQALLEKALRQSEQLGNRDLSATIRAQLETERKQEQIERLEKSRLVVQDAGEALVVDVPDVLFAPNQAEPGAELRKSMAEVAALILKTGDKPVRVEGHTDNTGTEQFNERLSNERAERVKTMLETAGVPAGRIVARGFGASRPAATNNTAEGRAQNRRVRVVIPK